MRNKKRDSSHRKQHGKKNRRDRTNKLRRARPRSRKGHKHHRELMKRLRRTGQYIFGDENK